MDRTLLAAVVDRIMPADRDGGAIAFGALEYLDRTLAAHPKLGAAIASGLSRLPSDFAGLDEAAKDAALADLGDPWWFRQLCELVAEGVYADPGNGGNPDAASWRMVGYEHGLPEGPTGPAGRHGQVPPPFSDFSGVLLMQAERANTERPTTTPVPTRRARVNLAGDFRFMECS